MLARQMYVAEYAGEFSDLNACKMDDGQRNCRAYRFNIERLYGILH